MSGFALSESCYNLRVHPELLRASTQVVGSACGRLVAVQRLWIISRKVVSQRCCRGPLIQPLRASDASRCRNRMASCKRPMSPCVRPASHRGPNIAPQSNTEDMDQKKKN